MEDKTKEVDTTVRDATLEEIMVFEKFEELKKETKSHEGAIVRLLGKIEGLEGHIEKFDKEFDAINEVITENSNRIEGLEEKKKQPTDEDVKFGDIDRKPHIKGYVPNEVLIWSLEGVNKIYKNKERAIRELFDKYTDDLISEIIFDTRYESNPEKVTEEYKQKLNKILEN